MAYRRTLKTKRVQRLASGQAGTGPAMDRIGCQFGDAGIYNYHSDAGASSATFAQSGGAPWRAALLGTVAAGALWIAAPRGAQADPDDCINVANTATCQGNQSDGIASGATVPPADFPETYTNLNVNNLNQNIAPAPGTDGINFTGDTSVTITSNTGAFAITATGVGADGIYASGPDGVIVQHTGNVTSANGAAIRARSDSGAINVTSNGAINGVYGIDAQSVFAAGAAYVTSDGAITADIAGIIAVGATATVHHSGDITAGNAANNVGIQALAIGGNANVTSTGDITAYRGIIASGATAVTVHHTGDLTGTYGIAVFENAVGASAKVTNAGAIDVGGLYAIQVLVSGAATVHQTGGITAANGYGIHATSNSGAVTVTSNGAINAGISGIFADGDTGVTIDHSGDIIAGNAATNVGIQAQAANGNAKVTSEGDITAYGGIFAFGTTGVAVHHTGDLTGRYGIVAQSGALGNVKVTNEGAIDVDGLFAIQVVDGGSATVHQTGGITAANGYGIHATSNSGAVTVTSNGAIEAGLSAIFAQGETGVTIDHSGDLTTTAGAVALFAISASGAVDITSSGAVTAPASAVGIFATGATGVTLDHSGDITANNLAGVGITATSSGGAVNVTSAGDINAGLYGIQAVGETGVAIDHTGNVTAANGSGIYGSSASGAVDITSEGAINASTLGIYANGETGVTIDHSGDVTSANSAGVYATSASGAVDITSKGAIDGYFGAIIANGDTGVTIDHSGNLTSAAVYGILARSDNGAASVTSSGDVDAGLTGIFAGGASGATVDHTGDVTATNLYGILAISSNGPVNVTSDGDVNAGLTGISTNATSSNIAVTVEGGAVTGGDGFYGVEIVDGATNVVVNHGTITSLSNQAILAGDQNDTVNNYGTVTGNVDLGGGSNAFNNFGFTTFNSGETVNLDGGVLTNFGRLNPGSAGTILTTDLDGHFVQTAQGIFDVDVDFSTLDADLLNASNSANLNGLVSVNQLNPQAVQSGYQGPVTILTSSDLTDNGIQAIDTVLVDYQLQVSEVTDDVVLTSNVNFVPAGLNQNQNATASNIDEIQNAGGSAAFTPLITALLKLPDLASLQDALDQLRPEAYLDTEIASLFAALDFSNGLFSCPVASGANAFIREGQCVWIEGGGRKLEQDSRAENFGFDEDTGQVSGGAQVAIAQDWFLGGALGYEWGDLKVDNGVESDVDRFSGGVALKYNPGSWLLAVAISGGQSSYDTTRPIEFPGFSATATSDHEVNHGSGQLRAAYLVDGGNVYLKPLVDLNATYLDLQGFTETGAGAANLNVAGSDQWVYSVSPAIELGGEMGDPQGLLIRPFVRGGITAFDDSSFQISSTFAAAPAVTPFVITGETDDLFYDVAAGADLFAWGNASLRIAYDGRFADDTEIHAGSARGRWGF